MFANFRLSLTWLHTWFGLTLGFVLMVAFFFGSLSVFDREIDRWSLPDTRIEAQPIAFSATKNDFLKAIAARSPKGEFPRGFVGVQPYWTIVGVDGGTQQGLLGEDGAIEFTPGTFSVAPVRGSLSVRNTVAHASFRRSCVTSPSIQTACSRPRTRAMPRLNPDTE